MSVFNDSQKRAILSGLLDIHRRLADVDLLLAQEADRSPFSRYASDLSATEVTAIREGFARLRAAMAAYLQEHGIPLDVQRSSLRWAVDVNLSALEVAVADLGPERLRGYGSLSEAGRAAAVEMQDELIRLLQTISRRLHEARGPQATT